MRDEARNNADNRRVVVFKVEGFVKRFFASRLVFGGFERVVRGDIRVCFGVVGVGVYAVKNTAELILLVPPAATTVISTAPSVPKGDTAMIWVSELTV